MSLRNIGIFAHVDAGKTTLSEQILLHAGAIRKAGSVDKGTAHTDNLEIEQRRGISVKSTCVRLNWKGTDINLIDTPGHADFTAEIERSLWALDGAVLLISGAEGVQPQTEILFSALTGQRIPTIIFVNKMDREGADLARVLTEIHRKLSAGAVLLSDEEVLLDVVSSLDDSVMEAFLEEGEVSEDVLTEALRGLTGEEKAFPVLSGSALRDEGVEALLDAVVRYLPPPACTDDTAPLCGVAFACEQNKTLGRGLWVRLFSGSLENRSALETSGARDPMTGSVRIVQKKITQIKGVDGEDAGHLGAGQIGVVYGLGDVPVGQVFGDEGLLPRHVSPGSVRMPFMTVQVTADKPEQAEALRQACMALSSEDPLLQADYSRETGELHLRVMGSIQLEILQDTLAKRFGLDASFGKPTIIYKETIAKPAYGLAVYTMPKPCWAILKFLIEPGERGSGVSYRSIVAKRDIAERYQHQVEQALPIALAQGRLGWEVTDVKITLVDGNHHNIHTHPLDFIVATPWGIQDGLRNGGSTLLEPILRISFLLPEECVGRVMSDVALMRGEILDTQTDGGRTALTALVPAAECMEYSMELAAFTGGRGSMAARLDGYRECPSSPEKTAKRRGVDPLDTSRYILAARSALAGDIFEA